MPRTFTKEALSVDPVKCQMDSPDEWSNEMETDFLQESIWKTSRNHRVNFRETNPSMQFRCLDLKSYRRGFDSVTKTSHKKRKTLFSADQKASLEAMFRSNQFPSGREKATMAAQLDIDLSKVQKWFSNRRQKWRTEQKKDALDASGMCREIFPGCRLGCFTQSFSASCEDEPLPVLCPLFVTELPPSLQFKQSFTAGHLLLPSLPDPGDSFTEQRPQTKHLVQQAAVPSNPAHRSSQPHAGDFRRLIDQFPSAYSFAEDLPNIFGNQENDDKSTNFKFGRQE